MWTDIKDWFLGALSGMYDGFKNLISNILYFIWSLLAQLVDGIERIFKKLAGLENDGKNDLVGTLIENDAIETIFKNLVSFATAIMIFFTIVKIIQDHYKEKDGGNPYKIVLRTFKGMLMFGFVSVAVTVGLYATGVVFRGLDAATSNGAASVSGQIFKAMAAEANRMKRGQQTVGGVKHIANFSDNQQWARIASEGGTENGKYHLVKVDNNTLTTEAELYERYMELCPEYQYGIVNADGSVSPISPFLNSLKTSDVKDDMGDYLNEYFGTGEKLEYDNDDDISDGNFDVGAGYKNDILSAVSLNITPSIDLKWSPIDIRDYTYEIMADGDPIAYDLQVMALGTGFNISFKIEKVKYWKTQETEKSLEESAKQFGISMSGSAGLQDGAASASFSFEMFDPDTFMDLLASVIINILYTNLMQTLLEMIPSMYVVFTAGPVTVNLIQLLSPIALELTQMAIDASVGELIPALKDENGEPLTEWIDEDEDGEEDDGERKEVKMVTPFRYVDSKKGNSSNRGVWVDINNKATNMPIVIEKYVIDGNFEELWSQLTDNWNTFVEDMNTATENVYQTYDENQYKIDEHNRNVSKQSDWAAYRNIVDNYNEYAKTQLGNLGNLLGIYEQVKDLDEKGTAGDIEEANQILGGTPENDYNDAVYPEGGLDDLKNEIKTIFVNLVKYYNDTVSSTANKKPSSNKADAIITPAIYKPILDLRYSNSGAEASNVDAAYIWDLFMNPTGRNANKIKLNMYVDAVTGYASRQIDWSAYGLAYYEEFNGEVADLYFSEKSISTSLHDYANDPVPDVKQSANSVKYITFDAGGYTYGKRIAFGYFFSKGEGPLYQYTDKGTIYNRTGYWGTRGVTVQGKRYYQAYDGSSKDNTNENNYWGEKGSTNIISSSMPIATSAIDVMSESDKTESRVYTSSAVSNESLQASKIQTMNEISALANVSEEKSPLATEFSKQIITFRKLGTAATPEQEADMKVMEDWVDSNPTASAPEGATSYGLSQFSATEIDALMAAGPGQRNYLMLTQDGTSNPVNNVYASFVGMFSYTDSSTVRALYMMDKMNYAIGFIALVSAVGVYLNFAFGLIKRAVNMAVLYVLSPITIAFYPFDDGSKFNQQFVSPFYKEAISAFAVIVSLNIFILLLSPVQKAVETVLGGLAGWIGGWLALVALTSMLPSIRDTICSVLGAAKMESKGIGQMIDDAANNLTSPFKGLKSNTVAKAREVKAKMRDKASKFRDGMAAIGGYTGLTDKIKNSAFGKKMSEIKGKYENSKIGAIGRTLSNRMSDKRINDAIAKGDSKGLSLQEKARYDKLQKKAKEALGPNATDAEIKAKMADEKFQKSVPSVMKGLHKAGNFTKKGLAYTLAGPVGWSMLANKAAGKAAGKIQDYAFNKRGTLVGEVLNDFIEKKKGDSKSALGARFRATDKYLRDEKENEILKKHESDILKRAKYTEKANDAISKAVNTEKKRANMEGNYIDEKIHEQAKSQVAENYAEKVLANDLKSKTVDEKRKMLQDAYAKDLKNQNPNMTDADIQKQAKIKADKVYNSNIPGQNRSTVLDQELNKMLVDEKQDYVKRFLAGEELLGMSLNSSAAQEKIRETAETIKPDDIAKKLQDTIQLGSEKITGDLGVEIGKLADAFKDALHLDNQDDKKRFEKLIEDHPGIKHEQLIDLAANEFGVDKSVLQNHDKIKDSKAIYDNVRDLQVALESVNLRAKAEGLLFKDMGDLVPPEAAMAIFKKFADVMDQGINSTNPDSLGAKCRKIENDASLSDEVKVQMKAKLKAQMHAEADSAYEAFIAQHGDKVHTFHSNKIAREEIRELQAKKLIDSQYNAVQYTLEVDTSPEVRTCFMEDGLVQKMMTTGDPSEGAIKVQQVASAVRNGDRDLAYSLGMDQATVDKMFEQESIGNRKFVDSFMNIGQTFASFLGCLDTDMGGTTLAGAKSALTNTIKLTMQKAFQEMYKSGAAAAAAEEARANESVTQFLSELKSLGSGNEWNKLYSSGGLVMPDGRTIRTQEEMQSAMDSFVKDINMGRQNYESNTVKMFINSLTEAANNSGNRAFENEVNSILQGISKADVGFNKGKEAREKNSAESKITAVIQESYSKLKPSRVE